jgi:hypothetical protein
MRKYIAKLLVVAAISVIGAYGADSSIGIWKFNAAKSHVTGNNRITSRTDVWEATPDGGIKITRSDQRADGTKSNFSFTCKYDGKECPVTGGAFDSISFKRVDANTVTFETKRKDGIYHQTGIAVISKDGKTKTMTLQGTDAAGKQVSGTFVYDKQ